MIILVADDNRACREAIVASLTHVGHQAIGAADGREAVEIARQRRPDVILMDLMMPKMDGWQALATLRADPLTTAIPILACTASHTDRERIVSAGFAGYIAKPARLPAMLDAIRGSVAGAAAAHP